MLGALGQEPARMAVAAARDRTKALPLTAGVFGADESEVGHQLARMAEAVDVALFADSDHRGDELKTTERHQGVDSRFESPCLQQRLHGYFDAQDSILSRKKQDGKVDTIIGPGTRKPVLRDLGVFSQSSDFIGASNFASSGRSRTKTQSIRCAASPKAFKPTSTPHQIGWSRTML